MMSDVFIIGEDAPKLVEISATKKKKVVSNL
ncbi:hypothetical protein SAMN05720781_3182 [Fibrobacter sp. UWT3]|nr:hypothetical protein SAMN05720781_3182 [Fibrobacter sp. UWT3]